MVNRWLVDNELLGLTQMPAISDKSLENLLLLPSTGNMKFLEN